MERHFHVYECTECVLVFAVEQAYDNHSDVHCPLCFNEDIDDVCSGSMEVSKKVDESMKETLLTYCGECSQDFKPNQIVWYAWSENQCFCSTCKENLQIQDWEPRKVPEKKT